MITKKQIKQEIEVLGALKGLVEVYEEVAAARMQRVRGAVLQSRQFLEGLSEVFRKIKSAYRREMSGGIGLGRRPGKCVAVFISANSGLYGDIVDRAFELFAEYVSKEKPEVVILGKLGVKMMNEKLPRVLFNYFDFSDEDVDLESFHVVMRYLIQFEKIFVFFGKFRTIIAQDPTMVNVTGDAVVVQEITDVPEKNPVRYLFEPSVQKIAKVFEGEILASIFEQTLHESQLAKFASRLMSLDESVDKIGHRMGQISIEKRRVEHREMNKKQLSTISGMSLWRYAS
jgi:F0F1-type ATP synthase gamma subunit